MTMRMSASMCRDPDVAFDRFYRYADLTRILHRMLPQTRGLRLDQEGRRRMAVNIRLAPPEAVADLRIDHFDGLDTFDGNGASPDEGTGEAYGDLTKP